MRKAMTAISVACAFAGADAAAWQKPLVDLGRPGAWEALERERPEHYRKLQEVVRTAQVETCETLPKILKTRLDVDSAQCSSYQLLTSLPPKRRLTLSLEGITYAMNVPQVKLAPSRIIPAPSR
jgi:hypothetical protein